MSILAVPMALVMFGNSNTGLPHIQAYQAIVPPFTAQRQQGGVHYRTAMLKPQRMALSVGRGTRIHRPSMNSQLLSGVNSHSRETDIEVETSVSTSWRNFSSSSLDVTTLQILANRIHEARNQQRQYSSQLKQSNATLAVQPPHQRNKQHHQLRNQQQQDARIPSNRTLLLEPVHSLLHYLISNRTTIDQNQSAIHAPTIEKWSHLPMSTKTLPRIQSSSSTFIQDAIVHLDPDHPTELRIDNVLIESIRMAASFQDFRLILRVMESLPTIMQTHGTDTIKQDLDLNHADPRRTTIARLNPRVLGEAIRGLSRCRASLGKLKMIWKMKEWESVWEPQSLGAREVNAMLTAVLRYGKVGIALDIYRQERSHGRVDAYSLSILFRGLKESLHSKVRSAITIPSGDLNTNKPYRHHSIPKSAMCWQWNEALELLDESIAMEKVREWITNPVISEMLRFNQYAHDVFYSCTDDPDGQHRISSRWGSRNALAVLDMLREHCVVPDNVTCTLIISSLDTEWKVAYQLLQAMQSPLRTSQHQDTWLLPSPNLYVYSAVMAVCARNQRYGEVWTILESITQRPDLQPNTWVYNTLLQAIVKSMQWYTAGSNVHGKRRDRDSISLFVTERLQAALRVVDRMETGASTNPDTVTFNTLLAVLGSATSYMRSSDWNTVEDTYPGYFTGNEENYKLRKSHSERIVWNIIGRMLDRGIERDAITYTHAIQALGVCGFESLDRLLQFSSEEIGFSERVLTAAFSNTADTGDIHGLSKLVHALPARTEDIAANILSSFIDALAKSGKTSAIPTLLDACRGDRHARSHLVNGGFDLNVDRLPVPSASHFSTAITSCLRVSDFENARKLLVRMQEMSLRPSAPALQGMACAYAVLALHFTSPTKMTSNGTFDREGLAQSGAVVRARSAYAIIRSLSDPSTASLSLVTKACAGTGLFEEAHALLRLIHQRVYDYHFIKNQYKWEILRQSFVVDGHGNRLPGLHRALLQSCAKMSNVTAALRFCEDIQHLAKQLTWLRTTDAIGKAGVQNPPDDRGVDKRLLVDSVANFRSEHRHKLGMKLQEWKLLLVAASKCGHWRLCLSTLQCLRPYIEQVHPSVLKNEKDLIYGLDQYKHLSPALTAAVVCLSRESQFAWIFRIIDDWVQWSGRRPPTRAALAALRALASNGRVDDVYCLLSHCLSLCPSATNVTGSEDRLLYVSAITSLYNNGYYDAADDIFVKAVSSGWLPYNLYRKGEIDDECLTLDLHGMNVAVAHSAVRVTLYQELLTKSWNLSSFDSIDLIIVTGRGRNSDLRMRPVLRPEVQRMLVEEFYPPLSTTSIPGNMGALRVNSGEVKLWIDFQRQQKGVRMLSIAAALKSITSGRRLRAALTKASPSPSLSS